MKNYLRLRDPAHHIMKIRNFPDLVKTKVEKYDSKLFEAGGYKWRIALYPNGRTGVEGNVCLRVIIDKDANAAKLTPGWIVDADVKVFVYNWKEGKYLVHEMIDGDEYSRYNAVVGAQTVRKFVDLKTFLDESNGYLRSGACAFGAEILVMETKPDAETLSMVNNPTGGSFTWKIPNYSTLSTKSVALSKPFTVGGRKWKIDFNPTGHGKAKGNWLSMYLRLDDAASLRVRGTVYAKYRLRVVNQFGKANVEKTTTHWFSSSSPVDGYGEFLSLGDLAQKKMGFIMDDTLILEVKIIAISISS